MPLNSSQPLSWVLACLARELLMNGVKYCKKKCDGLWAIHEPYHHIKLVCDKFRFAVWFLPIPSSELVISSERYILLIKGSMYTYL